MDLERKHCGCAPVAMFRTPGSNRRHIQIHMTRCAAATPTGSSGAGDGPWRSWCWIWIHPPGPGGWGVLPPACSLGRHQTPTRKWCGIYRCCPDAGNARRRKSESIGGMNTTCKSVAGFAGKTVTCPIPLPLVATGPGSSSFDLLQVQEQFVSPVDTCWNPDMPPRP